MEWELVAIAVSFVLTLGVMMYWGPILFQLATWTVVNQYYVVRWQTPEDGVQYLQWVNRDADDPQNADRSYTTDINSALKWTVLSKAQWWTTDHDEVCALKLSIQPVE